MTSPPKQNIEKVEVPEFSTSSKKEPTLYHQTFPLATLYLQNQSLARKETYIDQSFYLGLSQYHTELNQERVRQISSQCKCVISV